VAERLRARWRQLKQGPRGARVGVYAALAYTAAFFLVLCLAVVTGNVELGAFALIVVFVLACLHALVTGAAYVATWLVRRLRRR
jgi:hypothetical protein